MYVVYVVSDKYKKKRWRTAYLRNTWCGGFFSILALCYVFGRTKWWGRKKVAFLYIFFSVKDSHKSFWQSILVIIELSIYNDVRTLSGFFFILKRKQTIHYMPAFHIGKRYAMVFCTKFKKKFVQKINSNWKLFRIYAASFKDVLF